MPSLRQLCVLLCAALSLPAAALTITGEGDSDQARVIVKFKTSSPIARSQGLTPAAEADARAARHHAP